LRWQVLKVDMWYGVTRQTVEQLSFYDKGNSFRLVTSKPKFQK
jgi:hypothetical protein